MENKFALLNSGRRSQIGCYAGIPGTGPTGAICSGCVLLVPEGSKFVCSKYRRITGRKGKPISGNSAACRYFEPRCMTNSMVVSLGW